MIHDILNNAVSKWIGNTDFILAYLLAQLPGSVEKFWPHSSHFFFNCKDIVHPSEGCLYVHINWFLAQHQSFLGLSQPAESIRGCKARGKCSFQINQCLILVVGHWQRSLTWKLDLRIIRVAGSHLVIHLTVPLVLRRGAMRDEVLMFRSLQLHQHHLHQLGRFVYFPIFRLMEKHSF